MPTRLLALGLRLSTRPAHAVGKPGALLEEVGALFAWHFVLGLVVLICHVVVIVIVVLYDMLSIWSVPAALVLSHLPSA